MEAIPMGDTTGGNTVDARDIMAASVEAEHDMDAYRQADDLIDALEASGYRVVPADLVDGLRGIAARRCLSEGPCRNHSHPQCRGGSCVTCQARAHVAHLDGDDPLGVFAGNL